MDQPDTSLFIIVILTSLFCLYVIKFVTMTTQEQSWFSGEVENEAKVG